jgi:hypothetical protein
MIFLQSYSSSQELERISAELIKVLRVPSKICNQRAKERTRGRTP